MGFNVVCTRLLLQAKKLGVDFDKVLTIGRQNLHIREWEMRKLLNRAGYPGNVSKSFYENNLYAEPFLKWLGATVTDSMDASDYEGATMVHDLNFPISSADRSKYTLVIDGGSLEHVFNFPVAMKNCMDLIKKGGYYIGFTPANNHFGHGFYQFSPELFYRVFSAANGFRVVKMYLCFELKDSSIYEVADPMDVKERVGMINSYPSYLFVIAQKIEDKEAFSQVPQQSDYEHDVWVKPATEKRIRKNTILARIKKRIPLQYKLQILKMLHYRPGIPFIRFFRDTGIRNPKFIRKVRF